MAKNVTIKNKIHVPNDGNDFETLKNYESHEDPVRRVVPYGACQYYAVVETSNEKLSGYYSGADNIADAAKQKEYYRQAEKYGADSIIELQNGKYRFYEELKPAKRQGEMVGARHVREWNPYTGDKRDWYETLDHSGNIRQVRPDPSITGGVKVHYIFDVDSNYIGSWTSGDCGKVLWKPDSGRAKARGELRITNG